CLRHSGSPDAVQSWHVLVEGPARRGHGLAVLVRGPAIPAARSHVDVDCGSDAPVRRYEPGALAVERLTSVAAMPGDPADPGRDAVLEPPRLSHALCLELPRRP